VRWVGSPSAPTRLGDVAWAFEYNDRLGRFNCFYCGAIEFLSRGAAPAERANWQAKCFTLPQLVKAMSHQGADRPGFDEVKVFEVEEADPELALQWALQRSSSPDDLSAVKDSLSETREILMRYGVRGLGDVRGFSAPFLWYNILPGKSVPLRKLPVHLFQLRAATSEGHEKLSVTDVEDQVRKTAQGVAEVIDLGESFVSRVGTSFLVGLTITVEASLSVRHAHAIADRVEESIRNGSSHIRHIFIQVAPHER
jgi:hypothetical protein